MGGSLALDAATDDEVGIAGCGRWCRSGSFLAASPKRRHKRREAAVSDTASPFLDFLRTLLEQYPRLRATRLHEMIAARCYAGSLVQPRRAVARLRPRPPPRQRLERYGPLWPVFRRPRMAGSGPGSASERAALRSGNRLSPQGARTQPEIPICTTVVCPYGPEAADDQRVLERCYEEITSVMQRTLDELAREHPHPVLTRLNELRPINVLRRIAGRRNVE